MGQTIDEYGNYKPNPGPEPTPLSPSILIPVKFEGDPNGSISAPLDTLGLDVTNNTLYQNTDGGTTWTSLSSGGGSSPQVSHGSGAPVNPPTGIVRIYIDDDGPTMYLWNGSAWF